MARVALTPRVRRVAEIPASCGAGKSRVSQAGVFLYKYATNSTHILDPVPGGAGGEGASDEVRVPRGQDPRDPRVRAEGDAQAGDAAETVIDIAFCPRQLADNP